MLSQRWLFSPNQLLTLLFFARGLSVQPSLKNLGLWRSGQTVTYLRHQRYVVQIPTLVVGSFFTKQSVSCIIENRKVKCNRPKLLLYKEIIFFPNLALNSAFATQMIFLYVFFPNFCCGARSWTHVTRVESSCTVTRDLWRTLYRLSHCAAALFKEIVNRDRVPSVKSRGP